MRELIAALAVLTMLASATVAEARGGRTSAADCEAGSADPDCPDAPPAPNKPPAAANGGSQSAPAPTRK